MSEETRAGAGARRVLIFRSAPSWLFEQALEMIRAGGPAAIDVYCPRSISPQLAGREGLGEVFDDNWEGFYRSSYVTPALVGKLRARFYDQVVILYNDAFGEAYGPLRKLAFRIGARRVSSLNINLLWSGLKSEGIVGRYLLPRKWAYDVMIAAFTIEIVATTIWDRLAFNMKLAAGWKPALPRRHAR